MRRYQFGQNLAMRKAIRVRGEARIARHVHDFAEATELLIVAHSKDDPALRRGKCRVGSDVGVGVAQPAGSDARNQVVHRLVRQRAHHDIEQRHVDMLPQSGFRPFGQRGLNADNGVKPGEDIGVGHTDLLRRTIGLAGQVHDSAHALDDVVVSRAMGVGTVLPEASDRTVYEAGMIPGERGIIEPVLGKAADFEVFDHYVRAERQLACLRPACLRREVDRHRLLSAVCGMEIGGIAGAVRIFDEGRAPFAGIIALRAFDLDHFRTEVGEDLPSPRTGENPCEFHHPQAGERSARHVRTPPGR